MPFGYIADKLKKHLPKENVLTNEPMSKHTTFKIGGPADCLVMPGTIDELSAVLAICGEDSIPTYTVGNGSDLLVSDSGYSGVIIKITKPLSNVYISGTTITAQCGISLANLASAALESGLTGLEFAQGIPGTLGGGIYMNCGAYGGKISDAIKSVSAISKDGSLKKFTNTEMIFGYRNSILQQNGAIAIECELQLKTEDKGKIIEQMKDLSHRRQQSQPLEYPSAGSVFKRPPNNYAGKLIEEAGLKGFKIGGAQVSEKHGGFIINRGGATAKDVQSLIEHCRKKVYEQSKITLEPEILMIGDGLMPLSAPI